MFKNLILLDYNCHECRVFTYPLKCEDSEVVEEYIEVKLGINVSNVDWMLTGEEIEDNRD